MPNKRITMQDIADACGLSRNTVSKVFNQRGAVPQVTRDQILSKAQELGYGLPLAAPAPAKPAERGKSIALLTRKIPEGYHFATFFFTTFTDQVCRAGYNLKMFEISPEELAQKRLPNHLILAETAGLIGIELFDPEYLDMMCRLETPTLFIDGPTFSANRLMRCDFVTMENLAGISAVMDQLVEVGARSIGFVGDKDHCGSFHERWMGYCASLDHADIPLNREVCILAPDSASYSDVAWLQDRLNRMPFIPDAFVCANDFLALHLSAALKQRGLSIPKDVMIAGFDGLPQSALMEPPLTTVSIPGGDIGRIAADVLLRRIGNPDLPYSWTRVKTTPIWRESTSR